MQPRTLRVVPDHAVEPASALGAMARELAAAQEMALDLQITVAELVARSGPMPGDVLFRLQELDLLSQTLKDLSTFAAALGTTAPESWKIDTAAATRELHLRDLAVRLATGEAPPPRAPAAEAAGDDAADDAPGDEDDFLL